MHTDESLGTYESFAQEIVDTRIISDPWVEGEERFRLEPLVLSREQHKAFTTAVQEVGRAYDELLGLMYDNPELVDDNYYLTEWQRAMWLASGGAWHGIARADGFLLEDGSIRICELNADTPSGEPEAVILNQIRECYHPDLDNPNARFRDLFLSMVERSWRATFGEDRAGTPQIGLLYPTDIPEDLSMIELYRRWFQEKGWDVQLGSPYNLQRDGAGRLTMFGQPIDLLLRHYKTDWWGEREPILINDEEYLDPDPLTEQLQSVLGADVDGTVAIVNPFGAILAQNKVTMATLHKEIDRLSARSQDAIREYIPYSVRLCDVDIEQIVSERERWVLKSDFGCEGDEVMIGPLASEEAWERIARTALPQRWIAQEFFVAATNNRDEIPNFGLFLIGGESGGIFTRYSPTSTDYRAMTVPTFVCRT